MEVPRFTKPFPACETFCGAANTTIKVILLLVLSVVFPISSLAQGTDYPLPERLTWLSLNPKPEARISPCFPVAGWTVHLDNVDWWMVVKATNGYGNKMAWLALIKRHNRQLDGTLYILREEKPIYLLSRTECEAIFSLVRPSGSISKASKSMKPRVEKFDSRDLDATRLGAFVRHFRAWRYPAMLDQDLFLDASSVSYFFHSRGATVEMRAQALDEASGTWILAELLALPKEGALEERQ